ncbi:DsbE family thiol:disulfide interchange protein [Rodentibacter caecimuris]|uniref:Thiol:disulfide interchange protein n=1 Tax=Rodentibacter caecimuris TaxID=1796644 RepID=A0ABX3KW89_9PAST|nr:thiol:disulfide interchange protein [Rodentibacter heylii]OOF71084.1 thiol:disulfide interchange protein [Rodentibacter heylii]
MSRKLLVPLFLFLIICVVFAVQLGRNALGDDPKSLESALIGKSVPQRVLFDLFENKEYDSSIFQQNRPILLNVWATWCPTCFTEHQYLNKLSQQGIQIIGLNYKDDSLKAMKWLKDLGNPYQRVLKDEKGGFGLDLGVYGAPETFIIDGKGIIHYRYAGDVNEKVWLGKLKPIFDRLMEAK